MTSNNLLVFFYLWQYNLIKVVLNTTLYNLILGGVLNDNQRQNKRANRVVPPT